MTTISQPSVTIGLANADGEVGLSDQKVLLVGQKTSAGSAVSGVLVENISPSGAPEDALFGPDAMLSAMVRGFRKVNKEVQLDAIPLSDNGSGVPRVLDFTINGTATGTGSITVVLASKLDHTFEQAISVGDTAAVIAAALVALINADGDVPFTASNVSGAVTLTAVNDGTVANDLGVSVELEDAAGVSISVALVETTAGATDPTLTGVLDVATSRYQTIVWPFSDLTVLQTFLAARQDPTNDILDGVGIHVEQDSLVNLLAYGNAENDPNVVVFGEKPETATNLIAPAMFEASYVKAAVFAGVRSLRLTEGASISRFVTTSASLDRFGGPALASLPYFNTPLDVLPTIESGQGWTQLEIEQLLDAGVSVIGVNRTGTTPLVGEVVTTYKTDPASNPDPTFKFLNYVDTARNIREYFFNNFKARFAQSRLTLGAVTRGRDMVNEEVFAGYCEKLYIDLAGADFVLTQDGEDAIAFFKANLSVSLVLSTGTIVVTMLVPIVTQARTIIATIKIAFSTES